MEAVCLGFVDGHIPFVVTRAGIGVLRCCIPIIPGGDGATTAPLAERFARCHHPTTLIVGQAPTCRHHIAAAAAITRGEVTLALLPSSLGCPT